MSKKFAFNIHDAIPAAWDFLWKENLKRRKENEAYFKEYGREAYRSNDTYYLTASDIETQVRQWAYDTSQGKPWSQERGYGGYSHGVRLSGNLQDSVRNWLLRTMSGKIVGHNFGRGHISGMRFRPVGEPISGVEQETIKKKAARRERPTPKHYKGKHNRPLCIESRMKGRFSFRSSKAWTTKRIEEVNCARCKKLFELMCDKQETREAAVAAVS